MGVSDIGKLRLGLIARAAEAVMNYDKSHGGSYNAPDGSPTRVVAAGSELSLGRPTLEVLGLGEAGHGRSVSRSRRRRR
jgi:hypothetical protein